MSITLDSDYVPRLVLIRGLPGSGKTTLAKTKYPHHCLVEADLYYTVDGVYKYDPGKIFDAHRWCKNYTKALLEAGRNVVVANTFTRVWEMQPYFAMQNTLLVVEATGDYGSTHDVPASVVQRMRDRFEPFPPGLITFC